MKGLNAAKKAINNNQVVYGKLFSHNDQYRIFKIIRKGSHYYGLGYDEIWWPITSVMIEGMDNDGRR